MGMSPAPFLRRILILFCIVALSALLHTAYELHSGQRHDTGGARLFALFVFEQRTEWASPDDLELMAAAVAASPPGDTNSSSPAGALLPPRIAFLFLVRGPLPLAPLWLQFFKNVSADLFSVYVHASPDYEPAEDAMPPLFKKGLIPSKKVEWGEPSVVDAERRLLARAMLEPSNSHFVLLSESCIAIRPFSHIYKVITSSPLSFVHSYPDRTPVGQARYQKEFSKILPQHQFRKGQQWFVMSRELALTIVADDTLYPLFVYYCLKRRKCIADEHYIPSLLSQQHPERMRNESVTWTEWRPEQSHPATYSFHDISEERFRLIQEHGRLENTPTLFARKFDTTALGPLLALSEQVLGYPEGQHAVPRLVAKLQDNKKKEDKAKKVTSVQMLLGDSTQDLVKDKAKTKLEQL